jgi:glycosyltransferase involved in cell wall biosynthesis
VEAASPRSGRDLLPGLIDPRILYIPYLESACLAAQLNRGLAEARAEFVAIADADDLSEPPRLQKEFEYLHAHRNVCMVGTQLVMINGENQVVGHHAYPVDPGQILQTLPRTTPVCHGSALYRKAPLRAVGGFECPGGYLVAEDYDLASRLALSGARLANLPDALLRYRLHPGQIKATKLRQLIRATLWIKKRYWRKRMDLSDKARMFGESCLLCIPSGWVYRLVLRLRYGVRIPAGDRKRMPAARAPRGSGLFSS